MRGSISNAEVVANVKFKSMIILQVFILHTYFVYVFIIEIFQLIYL